MNEKQKIDEKNGLLIDKYNENVCFNEETHKYWNTKYRDLQYISITTLIGKYHEKFDEDFWSSYKAIERIVGEKTFKNMSIRVMLLDIKRWKDDYLDMIDIDKDLFFKTKDDIKKEYDKKRTEACEKGTAYHLMRENQWYEKPKMKINEYIDSDIEFEVEKHNWDLNRENAILPEYLIYFSTPDMVISLAGQIDLLVKNGNDLSILDYKGLSLDTPIATEFGWKLLKDITKDDRIFDKDGKLTNILNISNIHYNPCYKIIFDNGDSIIADHEHRWLISFYKSINPYIEKVMTTKEIFDYMQNNKRSCYTIPKIINTKSLDLPDIDLPIDPYVLGAWLGDGHKSCGIITNINPDFWNEILNRGYCVSKNLNEKRGAEMRTIYGISHELKKLNLIKNKHIPDLYLRASHKQRLDLLRGFMDTDGYYNKNRKRFVMVTGQEWQAEDMRKLIASLGWKPTVMKAKTTCNGKIFDAWHVCFFSTENPFLIRNQNIELKQKKDNASFRNIISIEPIETVPTKCLEVDSESHTFLAGYTLIPTHNTNMSGINTKAFYDKKTKSTKKMYYPIHHLEDTTFNHYALQLSFYAYMLQLKNPKFNIKQLTLLHNAGDGETKINVPYYKNEVKSLLIDMHKKAKLKYQREVLSEINN